MKTVSIYTDGACSGNPGEDILIITDDGTIIRMAVEGISLLGRATQGVRVMRLGGENRVISIEKTERESEESEETAETEPESETEQSEP